MSQSLSTELDKLEFVGLFARKRANRNSARASRSKFCRANRNWLQSSHRNYRRNGGRVSNRQPEAAEFKLCCRLKGGQQFRQPVRLISTARQGRFRSARAEFRLRSPDRTHRQIPIWRFVKAIFFNCRSNNRQLKRRTNVISIFPSEASLLRIVTAKAMDLSDEWEGISGKSYISPEKLQQVAEALQAASSQPQHPAA